ncbi:MAG: hypothetical protein J2P36_17415 [Ktedonobacteraceae bacterium]|nr:hypothetical protein [Ktedonobacteraceae bacterium]
MDLPDTNLSGIYYTISNPNGDYVYSNHILIYQDESQRLAYNYYLETEDNHGWYHTFEEGFVHPQATGRSLHFEVQRSYEWGGAGGMGYNGSWCRSTRYQPRESIQVYFLLNEAEIASAIEKGLLMSDRSKVVILRQEKGFMKGKLLEIEPFLVEEAPIYERVDHEKDFSRGRAGLGAGVVTIREELHNHWQDMTKEHIRARLAAGISPEDIASECDWTAGSIRALQKKEGFASQAPQKTGKSAKKKKKK